MSAFVYQLYRDGKQYAGPMESKEFCAVCLSRQEKAYPNSKWNMAELPAYGMFSGRAQDLVVGESYYWTAANNRRCKLVSVYNVDESGNGNVDMIDHGKLYMGASDQLYTIPDTIEG